MKSCCSSESHDHDHDHDQGHDHSEDEHGHSCHSDSKKIDWLLWGSLIIVVSAYLGHWLFHAQLMGVPQVGRFAHGIFELFNKMWWGLVIGIVLVGVLAKVPREFVMGVLGKGGRFSGLLRATLAGLMLDLCNHGILLVGMQLYKRGASLGQTMAFLIASPWNSLSLTIILVALIGLPWTLAFIFLSGLIALVSGVVFEILVRRKVLPPNPNSFDLPDDFKLLPEARKSLGQTRFSAKWFGSVIKNGLSESRMIMRWIFFGTVLAAFIRAVMPAETFGTWFGPSIAGLGVTLVVATILEVCSEGSSPIAADLLTRAAAPGNSFAFLMSGAATDYTEILSLRETTKSWLIAFALPAVTVPQVLVIGWILNQW